MSTYSINSYPVSVPAQTQREQQQPQNANLPERSAYKAPPRPYTDHIPSTSMIGTLTSRALDAKAKGMCWDRGSILNLLV